MYFFVRFLCRFYLTNTEDTVVTGVYKDDDEKYSLQRLLSRQEEGER